jgi:thioredoxin-related protein
MPRGADAVIALTIYSRPGCHLCEEMKAVVARVARAMTLTLQEIDISTDPALEARYGLEIPVLLVEGKKVAKYRVTEEELVRMLRARAILTSPSR